MFCDEGVVGATRVAGGDEVVGRVEFVLLTSGSAFYPCFNPSLTENLRPHHYNTIDLLQPRTAIHHRLHALSQPSSSSTLRSPLPRFSSMDIRRTGQLGNKEVMELLSRDSRWRITPREDCVKMVSVGTWVLAWLEVRDGVDWDPRLIGSPLIGVVF